MPFEHRLDRRRARTPLEAVDRTVVLHQHERWNVRDPELVREIRLLVHVDAHDADSRALLAGEVSQQALHPASRARPLGRKEDQQGLVVAQSGFPPESAGAAGERHLVLYPANETVKLD
jgi:hypothetical protein